MIKFPQNIEIRYATIVDIPSMLPLMEQFGRPATQDELESRFQKFTKNLGYGVVVACVHTHNSPENKIVGLIAWSKSEFFIFDKERFYLECLVVDKNYRRMGVGKRLVDFVEDLARQAGPSVVDLTSSLRREKDGTHDFYKSLGYKNEGERAKRYFRKEI